MSINSNLLKIASLGVAAAGFFISKEMQRRETEELVRKAVSEHYDSTTVSE